MTILNLENGIAYLEHSSSTNTSMEALAVTPPDLAPGLCGIWETAYSQS
jgi:hypothetical protein